MTEPTALLAGKRGLVMGVANDRSIAWGIAKLARDHGATIGLTYQGELFEKRVKPLAEELKADLLLDVDVSNEASMDAAFAKVEQHWGGLDFVVHAIGYSDKDELQGLYMDTTPGNFTQTMMISCYSFTAIARRASKLMTNGGSMITLTYYGAERVMPNYNVMGVARRHWRPACATLPSIWARATSASTRCRPGRSRRWPRMASATSATS